MTALGFSLEVSGLGAIVAALVSILVALVPRRDHIGATRRADLAILLAFLPGTACLFVMAGVSGPSILQALGLRPDHCPAHDHHLHLCAIHVDAMRPQLVALGATAFGMFAARAAMLASDLARTVRLLASFERLGRREAGSFPTIRVPGSPWLCHAAGALRPRILLSDSLAERLSASELSAAVAHEEAHLARRDPLALLALSLAGLFVLPPVLRTLRDAFRDAAEEACDASAAEHHGAPTVARALVSIARCQRIAPPLLPAFGSSGLEVRVKKLLAGPERPGRAIWVPVMALGLTATLPGVVLLAEPVHHGIETVLQMLAA